MTEKLSEGYDFIEESCGYMPLDFTEEIDAPIVESENGNSFRVIGKAKGPFQPMGEMSRNNRLYEADHWDIQLENTQFQDRLKSRDLLGTIGHHDKRVDDEDIAAGIVSHIVTCLEKRMDSNGKPYLYGELDILDTNAGRNLKALYEGGANLYISSRGAGKLLPVPNETYKKVDKNNYFCETFDIVRRPGFLKAKPLYERSHENVQESEVKVAENSKDVITIQESESAEVKALKGQVEKLTKIIEKMVDDIYEEQPEVAEAVKEEKKQAVSEELIDFIKLMGETNVSEETMQEILSMMFNQNKRN